MPSPFPGMDPYLEGSLWTTLHATLAIEMVRQLAPQPGSDYLVFPVERMVMDMSHVSIEIRDTAGRDLVTAIEILSPTNKRGEGRQEYLAKRRQILLSTAHLLEIDLLRQGHRIPVLEPLPPDPYFVFLSRWERRPLTEAWPIRFQDPLPTVPVPLQSGDADIVLDLQAAFTSVYDLLQYGRALNYKDPPEPPLDSSSAYWAVERLQAAGLV